MTSWVAIMHAMWLAAAVQHMMVDTAMHCVQSARHVMPEFGLSLCHTVQHICSAVT
jgi:hypothetical protein